MSSTVEERRHQEVHEQKKLSEQRTAKEKEAAAIKFKSTMAGQTVAKSKADAQHKESSQKQHFNQNLLLARNGIAGRNLAERLVKNQDQSARSDKELASSRDKDLKTDSERVDGDAQDAKAEARQQAQQFDGAVQQRDDEHKGQQDGQGQQQGQQPGQQQGGHSQQQGDKDKDERSLDGVGGAKKLGGAMGKANEAPNAGKIAIGKTQRAAAAERIPQQVLSGVVDKVAVMCTQGMNEFQIQLKDDAMGGGLLRVTLKDKKLKIAFTLKDASMKNLLESQKGLLMRMFERKGLALESMTVAVRT